LAPQEITSLDEKINFSRTKGLISAGSLGTVFGLVAMSYTYLTRILWDTPDSNRAQKQKKMMIFRYTDIIKRKKKLKFPTSTWRALKDRDNFFKY